MNGRTIGALLVLGGGCFGLVACGGNATGAALQGAAGAADSNPVAPGGGYQTPPPTYDTPPPTYDTPPPVYQTPTGASGAVCTQLCNIAASAACAGQATAAELAECPAQCDDALAQFAPCEAEFAAVMECFLRAPAFQDLLNRLCAGEDIGDDDIDAEALAQACESQALAFAQCSEGIDQNPNPQACSEQDACVGCDTQCDTCECQGLDPDTCTQICDAGL